MTEVPGCEASSAASGAIGQVRGASEVAIVGAGPAGTAAGIVLARAGVDVVVIDGATFPRDKTCGDALSHGSVELIESLGALDDVRRAPHALVHRAAAVFPDGTRIERDYDAPGWIVSRRDLDDALRRSFEAAGGRLLQGHRVAELVRERGVVTGVAGPTIAWSAAVVVAADGYGSVALDAPGPGPARGRWLGLSATEYWRGVSFPFGAGTCDHCFEHDLPWGYAWIFPAVDGVSNVGVYARADAYARQGLRLGDLFDAFLDRHADRFRGAERVGRRRAWSLPIAPRPMPVSAPGLLVAGDAAGFIDPLTGEGIWQALRSGMAAGEVARDAVRGSGLTESLRERYERDCEREVVAPSRRKARVQAALRVLLRHGLYRLPPVRAALRIGYQRQLVDHTKGDRGGGAHAVTDSGARA